MLSKVRSEERKRSQSFKLAAPPVDPLVKARNNLLFLTETLRWQNEPHFVTVEIVAQKTMQLQLQALLETDETVAEYALVASNFASVEAALEHIMEPMESMDPHVNGKMQHPFIPVEPVQQRSADSASQDAANQGGRDLESQALLSPEAFCFICKQGKAVHADNSKRPSFQILQAQKISLSSFEEFKGQAPRINRSGTLKEKALAPLLGKAKSLAEETRQEAA